MALTPASVVSHDSDIAHLQNVVYYERQAFKNLKGKVVTYLAMDKKPMPKNMGTSMRFFQYEQFAANTTPVPEGTPGLPIQHAGSITGDASVLQYSDFETFSDYLEDTSITPEVQNQAKELGFRATRTVDTINYELWDATTAAIAASKIELAGSNTSPEYFSAAVPLRAVSSLQNANVDAKSNGKYFGLFSPLVRYDYLADNANGGVRDLLKHNDFGELKKGPHDAFTLDGVTWLSSTFVPTTSNYLSGGQTAYHSYIIGEGAFWCTSLFFAKVPSGQNFTASIARFKEGQSVDDPAGLISAAAYYKFYYGTFVMPDGIARHRQIKSEVSIS